MGESLRVLIIDDDPATRRAIARALRDGDAACEVVQCADGGEGLGRLRGERFDCAFIDYLLPTEDGLSVLRESRAAGVATPIVLVTGMGDEALAVEAMRAGAADYISKSRMTADSLRQSLRHALRFRESERREHEALEQLRRSEERLGRIVETIADGVFILDRAGNYVFANAAAVSIFGVPAAVITRHNYRTPPWKRIRVDGTPLPIEEHPYSTVLKGGGRAGQRVVAAICPDGRRVIISISAAPLLSPAGELEGGVATFRDVTAQHQAEEALRESEEHYRQIVETAEEGVWTGDARGRTTFVNAKLASMLGYAQEEMAGRPYTDFMDPGMQAEVREYLQKHPASGRTREEVRFRRKDGGDVWALVAYSPIQNIAGQPAGALAMITDISDLRRTADALRESQRAMATLMSNLPGMAYRCRNDVDWTMEFVSAGCVQLTGYEPEELVGNARTSYANLIHPEDRAAVWDGVQARVRERRPFQLIYRIIGRGGEKWVWEQGQGVFAADGQLVALEGFIADITARKLAEQRLAEAEERYRTLFMQSPCGVKVVDPQTRLMVEFNATACEQLGYTPEEFCNVRVEDYEANEDPEKVKAHVRYILQHGGDEFETRVRRKDGEVRIALTNVRPVLIRGRTLMLVLTQDITERQRVQEELRRSEDALRQTNEQLRALIGAAPLAIVSLDLQGRVLTWNPAATRIFGWTEAEAVGRPLPTVAPDQQGEHRDLIDLATRGSGITGVEVQRLRKDGSVVDISLSAAQIRDAMGRVVGLLGIMQDVTEARRLKEQLLSAARMETVGRLAGGIAHDFNNLLAVISGYSESLLRRMKDDAKLRQLVQEIERAADRGSALVKQLTTFSRRQMVEMRCVDLHQVLDSVYQMLHGVLSERIDISIRRKAKSPLVNGDASQLEQVVINLALNARDAMPDGGVISIETSQTTLRDSAAARLNLPPGQYVRLSVSDTGIGMDEQTRQRIFEPFFTTKGTAGTGLGLSIVYGIVHQAGGAIDVSSEPNHGTTFTILLPRCATVGSGQ